MNKRLWLIWKLLPKSQSPHGYEYFVIDAGWFGEFELQEGTLYPAEKHAEVVNFNGMNIMNFFIFYIANEYGNDYGLVNHISMRELSDGALSMPINRR